MMHLYRDHASGTGYEYALGRPEIRNGDIVVPAGWGPREALTPDSALSDEEAATAAHLLGCGYTVIAPPAATPRALTAEERAAAKAQAQRDAEAARKARVQAYLAAEQRRADEAAKAAKAPQ